MVRPNVPDGTSGRTQFKANPVKHYRRGLGFSGTAGSATGRSVTLRAIDTPGGMSTSVADCDCAGDTAPAAVTVEVPVGPADGCCVPIMRSAQTRISPTYYQSTAQYLKRRGRTYDQNSLDLEIKIDASDGTECAVLHTVAPRNKKHFTNTAVSSSARIARLHYDDTTRANVVNTPPLFIVNAPNTSCRCKD